MAAAAPTPITVPEKITRELLLERLKSGQKKSVYRTDERITLVMLDCGGDRAEAARRLGWTEKQLQSRLSSSVTLRSRFGRDAQKLLAKQEYDAIAKSEGKSKVMTLLQMKIEELVIGQAQVAAIIMRRLKYVNERIENGNEVKRMLRHMKLVLDEKDKEFIERWKFEDRDEEKSLLQQEAMLLSEYGKAHAVTVETNYRKAKTEATLAGMGYKSDEPTKPEAPKEKPKRQLSSPPKGVALVPVTTKSNEPKPADAERILGAEAESNAA